MSDDNGRSSGSDESPDQNDPARRQEDAALKARLEKLSASLDARKQADLERSSSRTGKSGLGGSGAARAIGLGMRIVSDLVGGVLVGAAIGYGLDWLFSTSPWMLILFLLLGTAGGFWNVIRTASKM